MITSKLSYMGQPHFLIIFLSSNGTSVSKTRLTDPNGSRGGFFHVFPQPRQKQGAPNHGWVLQYPETAATAASAHASRSSGRRKKRRGVWESHWQRPFRNLISGRPFSFCVWGLLRRQPALADDVHDFRRRYRDVGAGTVNGYDAMAEQEIVILRRNYTAADNQNIAGPGRV